MFLWPGKCSLLGEIFQTVTKEMNYKCWQQLGKNNADLTSWPPTWHRQTTGILQLSWQRWFFKIGCRLVSSWVKTFYFFLMDWYTEKNCTNSIKAQLNEIAQGTEAPSWYPTPSRYLTSSLNIMKQFCLSEHDVSAILENAQNVRFHIQLLSLNIMFMRFTYVGSGNR